MNQNKIQIYSKIADASFDEKTPSLGQIKS